MGENHNFTEYSVQLVEGSDWWPFGTLRLFGKTLARKRKYRLVLQFVYRSERLNTTIIVKDGYHWDGPTFLPVLSRRWLSDIIAASLAHDVLYGHGLGGNRVLLMDGAGEHLLTRLNWTRWEADRVFVDVAGLNPLTAFLYLAIRAGGRLLWDRDDGKYVRR